MWVLIQLISRNTHKYSIAKMCLLLGVSRSNYYYEINRIQTEVETTEDKEIIQIFKESTNRYVSRKIKFEL